MQCNSRTTKLKGLYCKQTAAVRYTYGIRHPVHPASFSYLNSVRRRRARLRLTSDMIRSQHSASQSDFERWPLPGLRSHVLVSGLQ